MDFKKIKIFIIILIFSTTILTYFSYLSRINNGFEDRVHVILKNMSRINLWEKNKDENGICFDRSDDFCNFYSNNQKTIFIIGDSIMEVISSDLINKVDNFNYITINRAGCIYLPNVKKLYIKTLKEKENCTLNSKSKIENLLQSRKNSIIIIGGELTSNLNAEDKSYIYKSTNNFNLLDNFIFSINRLLINNNVILIYPVPYLDFDIKKRIMEEIPKSTFNATDYLNENPFTTEYSKYLKYNSKTIYELDKLSHENLYKVYPDQIFCDKKFEKKCFANEGKKILYTDRTHLSTEGAKKLNNIILKKIEIILSKTKY